MPADFWPTFPSRHVFGHCTCENPGSASLVGAIASFSSVVQEFLLVVGLQERNSLVSRWFSKRAGNGWSVLFFTFGTQLALSCSAVHSPCTCNDEIYAESTRLVRMIPSNLSAILNFHFVLFSLGFEWKSICQLVMIGFFSWCSEVYKQILQQLQVENHAYMLHAHCLALRWWYHMIFEIYLHAVVWSSSLRFPFMVNRWCWLKWSFENATVPQ